MIVSKSGRWKKCTRWGCDRGIKGWTCQYKCVEEISKMTIKINYKTNASESFTFHSVFTIRVAIATPAVSTETSADTWKLPMTTSTKLYYSPPNYSHHSTAYVIFNEILQQTHSAPRSSKLRRASYRSNIIHWNGTRSMLYPRIKLSTARHKIPN